MRLSILIMILVSGFAAPAMSADIASRQIPNAQKVGEGRLSIAFWDIYDATLYAPNGQWNDKQPFALSIRYFRKINGPDIAERSIEEMQKQGFSDEKLLADWRKQMQAIFPDVKEGTDLVALFTANKTTFYHNGKIAGAIKDSQFAQQFSNIWLSEKTSEPALRRALLGQL